MDGSITRIREKIIPKNEEQLYHPRLGSLDNKGRPANRVSNETHLPLLVAGTGQHEVEDVEVALPFGCVHEPNLLQQERPIYNQSIDRSIGSRIFEKKKDCNMG